MNKVIKRDGSRAQFNKIKVSNAVIKAFIDVDGEESNEAREIASKVADSVSEIISSKGETYEAPVEDIQRLIISQLMSSDRKDVAESYVEYRYKRKLVRDSNTTDKTILEIIENKNDYWATENSNKNSMLNTTIRDYMAGETSTDISRRLLLPKDVVDSHDKGIIHFHDIDYFAQHMHNCDLVNLETMLQDGTVISDVLIETPHSFSTACNVATQVIAQVASAQYGGQSVSLAHLAPFVDVSRKAFYREVIEERKMNGDDLNEEKIKKIVNSRLRREINKGIQTIQYQVITLMTTNGQAPFLTLFMYLNEAKSDREKEDLAILIEEVLKQRLLGVKNSNGVYVTPAFPKLIYVLEEDNIHEGDQYFYLTELAAKCTAKRLVPDYISEKIMLENKIDSNGEGHCYTCMGCRSFLTPYINPDTNEFQSYGRFNQGVVTINLPDIAFSSGGDIDEFWRLFEERTELCYRALMCRHRRLEGTVSDVAPILWQNGALARLKSGETIDKLLHGGYSTISLGYAGLYECVKYMTGSSHSDRGVGEKFGLQVMKSLNDKCNEWKARENVGFSLYGSPIESTTYKFAKCLKKRFGNDIFEKLDGLDRNYITNSYHVPVFEHIDAFNKLEIESRFQILSPGGAISYVETPDMQNNIPAVIQIIQFIYDNIMYAELNTKSDYCYECGYDGEIECVDGEDKFYWRCPNCGNTDQSKMHVARRTCGYIGANFWNEGRTNEIYDRVLHVDDEDLDCE